MLKRINHLLFLCCITYSMGFCSQLAPEAGIKEIRVADKSVPFSDTVTLQPDDEDLTIYFVDSPSVDYYLFQLIGVDYARKSERFAYTRYTNLKGKHYPFQLATVVDGDTSETYTLLVEVLPKTVETTWFVPALILYVAMIFFAITFLWLMYHYRQKMRLHKIRMRIAGDLHDEVQTTLSSIAISSMVLQKEIGDIVPNAMITLGHIIESAEETNNNLRDTVWSLNPELDIAGVLFEKIRSVAIQILTAKNIQLDFNAEMTEIKNINIGMLQRRNVYLMACESINNIIKHANATEVGIKVKKKGRQLLMIIQDNGKGFDCNREYPGNGLKNLQRRAKESFIKLELISKQDQGTTVKLIIPLL